MDFCLTGCWISVIPKRIVTFSSINFRKILPSLSQVTLFARRIHTSVWFASHLHTLTNINCSLSVEWDPREWNWRDKVGHASSVKSWLRRLESELWECGRDMILNVSLLNRPDDAASSSLRSTSKVSALTGHYYLSCCCCTVKYWSLRALRSVYCDPLLSNGFPSTFFLPPSTIIPLLPLPAPSRSLGVRTSVQPS